MWTPAFYTGQSLQGGQIDFQFRVGGDGKVESVTVKAPAPLSTSGSVPCSRKAVYDHQFPKFDGPGMSVNYNIQIGE